jgi:hypothetical protein
LAKHRIGEELKAAPVNKGGRPPETIAYGVNGFPANIS